MKSPTYFSVVLAMSSPAVRRLEDLLDGSGDVGHRRARPEGHGEPARLRVVERNQRSAVVGHLIRKLGELVVAHDRDGVRSPGKLFVGLATGLLPVRCAGGESLVERPLAGSSCMGLAELERLQQTIALRPDRDELVQRVEAGI